MQHLLCISGVVNEMGRKSHELAAWLEANERKAFLAAETATDSELAKACVPADELSQLVGRVGGVWRSVWWVNSPYKSPSLTLPDLTSHTFHLTFPLLPYNTLEL
jgi:hypothetical protein